jgi:AraC-like DNA-binding protein
MEEIARVHRMSRRQMEMLFAEQRDSPSAYLRRLRLRRASVLLHRRDPAPRIAEVAHSVGFLDVTTFIRAFRKEYACTPGEWQRLHTNDD